MRAALVAPLALAATLTVVLSACGASQTTSDAPTPPMPTVTSAAPSTSPAAPTTSTAPSSSAAAPTSSAPTSSAPSKTPTSSTPTVTITPTSAPKVLDFGDDGKEVRLPVADNAVPGAPAGFIDGMRAELNKQWASYGNQPGCEEVPVLWVTKVSTAGYAAAAYNDDPSRANGSKCANVGGGAQEFWADVDGTWKPVITAQDLPSCTEFEKYGFPSAIVGTKCTAHGSVVDYKHA